MSSLSTTTAQLDAAWKRLHQRWEDTKAIWNDQVQRHFEKEYWALLEGQTQATLKEMGQLAQVIAQARQKVK